MIERLLAAERARTAGELDRAEALLSQVAAADPRNAMAVVGLARVALDRGDATAAEARARRALEIDLAEAAAQRILDALRERVIPAGEPETESMPPVEEPPVEPPIEQAPAEQPPVDQAPTEEPPNSAPRRSWFRRLLDRLLERRDLPS